MHPDDIDELVREAQHTPTTAVAQWRETAGRILGRSDPDVVGAPGPDGRRQFLRLGGGGVLAAAVLAACGSDEVTPPSETGVTEPQPVETTLAPPRATTPEEGATQDSVVTRTHRSLELAAVQIYSVLLDDDEALAQVSALQRLREEITYDEGTEGMLTLLRNRHRTHAEALVGLIETAGGEPIATANRGILDGLLGAQIGDLTTQRAVLQFAGSIETLAAATYAWGAGTLSTPQLRQSLMAIGAVAARQAALVSLLIDPTGASAVPAAVLDTSGPARLPEYMLVADGQEGTDALAEAEEAPADDEDAEGEDAPEGEDTPESGDAPEGGDGGAEDSAEGGDGESTEGEG